jgi:hypothetical protein
MHPLQCVFHGTFQIFETSALEGRNKETVMTDATGAVFFPRLQTYTPNTSQERTQSQFASLGVIGWVADNSPSHAVRLTRSQAEQFFATFAVTTPHGDTACHVLLSFDYVVTKASVVTAASLWEAVTTSHADSDGGMHLGVDRLVAADRDAPEVALVGNWDKHVTAGPKETRRFCRKVYDPHGPPLDRHIRCGDQIVAPALVAACAMIRPFVAVDPDEDIVVAVRDGRQGLFGFKVAVTTT